MSANATTPAEPAATTRAHVTFRLLLVVLVALLYVSTMAPDVMTDDSAEFQVHCPQLQPTHPPGYPLLLLIGKTGSQLPLGTVAWRMSLMSVVFGLVAVVLLYEFLALILSSVWVAFATALVFAVSHTFWMQSLMPEAYSLNAAFHTLLLYLLARYERQPRERGALVAAIAFLLAFATGNHQVIVLMLPAYALWLWWSDRGVLTPWRLLGAALAFGVGASVYLVLTIRMRSLPESLDLATGGPSRGLLFVFGPAQLLKRFAMCIGFHGYQFPLIAGVVGIGGWLWAWRRRRAWWALTTALWLITVVYALNFDSSDVYVFYVPAYIACAVWIGFGFDALYRSLGSRPVSAASLLMVAAVALPPFFYGQTYRILERKGEIGLSRDKGIRYYLFPPKHNADWFGNRMRHLVKTAARGGAVLTDWNYFCTGRYLREIERWRPDVGIYDVTLGSSEDRRAADKLMGLIGEGRAQFYFPGEEIARSAAGDLPCLLHTVGWRAGRDPLGSVREARRRLERGSGEVRRSQVPSVWDEIAAWIEQGRPAASAFGPLEGLTFRTDNVAVCQRKGRPVSFAIETSRLLRGQGVWMAIENFRELLPFDGWTTTSPVTPERLPGGKPISVYSSIVKLGEGESGAADFRLRRPLHGNSGRFDPSAISFVYGSSGEKAIWLLDSPGQAFFHNDSLYQYLIVPTEVPAGDYGILLSLTVDAPSKAAPRTGAGSTWESRVRLLLRLTVE